MYDATKTDPNDVGTSWTDVEVHSQVSEAMDPKYADVVKFCLGAKYGKHLWGVRTCVGKDGQKAYLEALKDYYAKVYMPLTDRAEGKGLEGDGPMDMEYSYE
ncbi:hypothetical protein VTL71DRAFT_11456 [Oculimacula yallundae]|uniref:Uncharacterized protein n=1 Tax=Oculimacula yallundae TaxID=86028 RepID=A0ABR4CRX2_9HELO